MVCKLMTEPSAWSDRWKVRASPKPGNFMIWPRFLRIGPYLAVMLAGLLLAGCGPHVTGLSGPRDSSPAVAVVVELAKPPGDSQELSRARLQTEVEARFRKAGVRVAPPMAPGALPEAPLVYVNVKIARIDDLYGYNIDILCMNAPGGRPLPAKLANCSLAASGLVREMVLVKEKVAELVNRFLTEYLLAGGG
jgi:hypothetical protein